MHCVTMFIPYLACYFSCETSMAEEQDIVFERYGEETLKVVRLHEKDLSHQDLSNLFYIKTYSHLIYFIWTQ